MVTTTVKVANDLTAPVAEYSQAVAAAGHVFVGAKGGTRFGRPPFVEGSFRESVVVQLERTLDNFDTVARHLCDDTMQLRQMTVFLTDWRLRDQVEQVLDGYGPARAAAVNYRYARSFAIPELLVELDGVYASTVPTAGVQVPQLYFSDDLGAARGGGSLGEEVDGLAAAMRRALADVELAGSALVRVHLVAGTARDGAQARQHLRQLLAPHALITQEVGIPALPDRALSATFIAARSEPAPVTTTPPGGEAEVVAVSCGDLVFSQARAVSLAGGAAPVEDLFAGLDATVSELGLSRSDVVKLEGTIADWRHYPDFRQGYAAAMAEPFPTRSLVQSSGGELAGELSASWILATRNSSRTYLVTT